jgi:YD repeat-containing protein
MTEYATIERMRGEDGYPIDIDADAFAPWTGLYGRVVYRNTAALMGTLRNLAGPEVFDRALRTYADRYRFAHPTGEDLERVLLEEIGPRVVLARGAQEPLQTADVVLDVAEALEQGLRTSRTAAFSVLSVSNRPLPGTGGYHRDEGGDLLGGDPPDWRAVEEREDSAVEGVVMLHRDGDFVIPVEIEVEFADGTTTRLWWDGRSRLRELRWPGRRVTLARVDPYRRLSIEADRRDNHRAATPIAADSIPVQDMGELGMAAALALMVGVFP